MRFVGAGRMRGVIQEGVKRGRERRESVPWEESGRKQLSLKLLWLEQGDGGWWSWGPPLAACLSPSPQLLVGPWVEESPGTDAAQARLSKSISPTASYSTTWSQNIPEMHHRLRGRDFFRAGKQLLVPCAALQLQ